MSAVTRVGERRHSAAMLAYWKAMRAYAAKKGITVREARKDYKLVRAKMAREQNDSLKKLLAMRWKP